MKSKKKPAPKKTIAQSFKDLQVTLGDLEISANTLTKTKIADMKKTKSKPPKTSIKQIEDDLDKLWTAYLKGSPWDPKTIPKKFTQYAAAYLSPVLVGFISYLLGMATVNHRRESDDR